MADMLGNAMGVENYIHIMIDEQAEERMLKTLFDMAVQELEAEGAPAPVFINMGYYQADQALADQIRMALAENPFVATLMLIGLPSQTRSLMEMLDDIDLPMDSAENHQEAVRDFTELLARNLGQEIVVSVTSQQNARSEETRSNVRRQLLHYGATGLLVLSLVLAWPWLNEFSIERYGDTVRVFYDREVIIETDT
jgi:hypothetical protein